jgi:hypothetical protein
LNTNVTDDDPRVTGKIARAHLNEFPDCYTRLERMEDEARRAQRVRRLLPSVRVAASSVVSSHRCGAEEEALDEVPSPFMASTLGPAL